MPLWRSQHIVCFIARLVVFFGDLFITSAVIQAGLALPMAIYFHRVSFTGLSANAVVVPLLGLVVPLGFLRALHRVPLGSRYRGVPARSLASNRRLARRL